MSSGADLERTSIEWVDNLKDLEADTVEGQNRIVAAAAENMMEDLRRSYARYRSTKGASNAFVAAQLASRIENTLELLPAKERNRLNALYQTDLAKAQQAGGQAAVDMDRINKQRTKALKALAKPNTDAMKGAGRRLDEFWGDENSKLTDRVKALTRQAALEGKSWRSLSQQIQDLLVYSDQNLESRRKTHRMGLAGRAELIARTEMAYAFIQGQKDNYRKMGYDHVRWSAASERTCGYCMSRDGLVYELEAVENAIPAHPRCRCSLVPVDAPSLNKPKGPNGPDAAEQLDDSYWTKSRQDKLNQWKQENRGIRDPKTEALLNQMLQDYAKTPTNTERYFQPDSEAGLPKWMPSGSLIPNMLKAEQNARRAADREDIKAQKKAELEAEAELNKELMEQEQERLEEQAGKDAEDLADKARREAEKAEEAAAAARRKALEEVEEIQRDIANYNLVHREMPNITRDKWVKYDDKMKEVMLADAERRRKKRVEWEELAEEKKRLTEAAANGDEEAADTLQQMRDDEEWAWAEDEVTTDEVGFEYDPAQWEEYGYDSEDEFRMALDMIKTWTQNGYTGVRGQQLLNALKNGENLSDYEKDKARRYEGKQERGEMEYEAFEYERMADALEDLVYNAPKYKGDIYRGIHTKDRASAEALIEKFARGDEVKTLTSWSADKGKAEDFTWEDANGDAMLDGGTGVLWRVNNRDGAPVSSRSAFGTEEEVLVPSGMQYRVNGVKERMIEGVNVFEVDLEVVEVGDPDWRYSD